MKDERIEQAKLKMRSEMAIIILYGVALSFSVKNLVFKMNFQESIIEYLILIFFPLYQFIRMHMMKVSIYSERGNKQSIKNLLITIVILVVASAVLIYNSMKNSAVYDWQSPVVFLFIFLALFVAIFFIANKFNQHKGHKYEKEFDD
ncbi:hypothetical protein E4K67_10760 [Desulfosporosinus fructosivorans]|uniref:Uncharacterized protein n=1 Tax=Desulfosporosinus fructosivorans TaxID=2018669 RepID=A0A4Z0R848_9FIRM|nr:DUF6773 family protein [Desulfosporosinus fructosivorans]TGE38419.1 hypothetical protein E4K67_10760 [Desulfosporosinus fructosivorans]